MQQKWWGWGWLAITVSMSAGFAGYSLGYALRQSADEEAVLAQPDGVDPDAMALLLPFLAERDSLRKPAKPE